MSRRVLAAMVLGVLWAGLSVACSRAALEQEAADARKQVNTYCDERAKALDALQGEAGAQ